MLTCPVPRADVGSANEGARLAIMAERPAVGRLWNRRWLLVLAYVVLIFVLSAQPGLYIPGPFELKDKIAHAAEYAGLSWLVHGAVRTSWPGAAGLRRVLPALLGVSLLGVADEIFQLSVPGRDSSVYDWVADTVGATIAQVWCVAREKRRGGA